MTNFTEDKDSTSYNHLRSMFLPIRDNDSSFAKMMKNGLFYLMALMMFISTLLIFAAVLIAA